MLTKTQVKIMEIFTSKINETFSIKQISKMLSKPYPLIHRTIKSLIEEKRIIKDKKGFLSLNFRDNHTELMYIESLKKEGFLKKNKTIFLFVKDVLDKIGLDFFIFLFFGSAVENQNGRDTDVLIVVDKYDKIENIERIVNNIASNFSLRFDINVISVESMYEMLSKRNEKNVINETLDNHVVIFGAENYYRIIKNVR